MMHFGFLFTFTTKVYGLYNTQILREIKLKEACPVNLMLALNTLLRKIGFRFVRANKIGAKRGNGLPFRAIYATMCRKANCARMIFDIDDSDAAHGFVLK